MSVGSWLKSAGVAIYHAASQVIGFLASPNVQNAEKQAVAVAELLLPQDAPIIQGFQNVVGKIFQQVVVAEAGMSNVANAGPQKAQAVFDAVTSSLTQYVQNNFPGAATVDKELQAGLIKAIADFVNALPAPSVPPAQAPTA